MSVICQNFVQNAWKKDLCSNCFKSVGDHEVGESVSSDDTAASPPQSRRLNTRQVSRSTGVYSTNGNQPHTTWKSLISDRNQKNSQPFKLENGFQGRLLTINKATHGIEKKPVNGESVRNGHVPSGTQDECAVKTSFAQSKLSNSSTSNGFHSQVNGECMNGEGKQNGVAKHQLPSNKIQINGVKTLLNEIENKNGKSLSSKSNGIAVESTNKTRFLEQKFPLKKLSKSKSEERPKSPLHSILKKTVSNTETNSCQPRRGSNVGFKDEEPLVIGYGGRDFSPEELEWEMNCSDSENGHDSLDETEDDKAFSKITLKNTEFNSDNSNLLQQNSLFSSSKDKNIDNAKYKNCNQKEDSDIKNSNAATSMRNSSEDEQSGDSSMSGARNLVKREVVKSAGDISVKGTDNSNGENESSLTTRVDVKDCEMRNEKMGRVKDKEYINVAIKNGESDHAVTSGEIVVVGSVTKTASSGVENQNRSEFVNEATPPSLTTNSDNTGEDSESEKSEHLEMLSDGSEISKGTCDTGPEETIEWQADNGELAGEILQAINTSLTNRHKMNSAGEINNENTAEFSLECGKFNSNEVTDGDPQNKQLDVKSSAHGNVVVNVYDSSTEKDNEGGNKLENAMNVEPRTSFLHSRTPTCNSVKPSAIYGPASDLFVSRSNSSSSSSSDECGKTEISHSISVTVNGQNAHRKIGRSSSVEIISAPVLPKQSLTDYETDSSISSKYKPRIPEKPSKRSSCFQSIQIEGGQYSKPALDVKPLHSNRRKSESSIFQNGSYYSVGNTSPLSDGPKSFTLVDHYAESNIYHEVVLEGEESNNQDIEVNDKTLPKRETKLAALAIELEQVRHSNNTKRQAPAPPKIPDPPLEDPPSSTGRASPSDVDSSHGFSSFRGEAMAFSSSSSTTSTSSQDTETGYASWNLHGDIDDKRKHSKSKSSFLLTQYSKCKMLAMGYADDNAKSRKKFSIKKLLKIRKDCPESNAAFDPNCPNPKAWKYSDHFERPRAKLEIIHPMDLENKSVTVNPGFDSLHSGSLSSFTASADDLSLKNSVSSDYGSFYSDTVSPTQDFKTESNYECIQSRLQDTEDTEDSDERIVTTNSPTPSRSSCASQASTLTSESSKNGAPNRPPKPPPPPRAHSLLPRTKPVNPDGTFKFPIVEPDAQTMEDVNISSSKPQAPKRQGKSTAPRPDFGIYDNTGLVPTSNDVQQSSEDDNLKEDADLIEEENHGIILVNAGMATNKPKNVLEPITESNQVEEPIVETQVSVLSLKSESPIINVTVKSTPPEHVEKTTKSAVLRNKHPPITKAPARPPPIYMKPQLTIVAKNPNPWKTLEDSYLVLTASNRELLVKLVNQASKKRKIFSNKLQKMRFKWSDFEIDLAQPSSIFAFGEKIAYHATMPQYPEYLITLVITVQQAHNRLNESSELKYPVFGQFIDCIPQELLDSSGDAELESMQATILVLNRSNITTIECFTESLPTPLTEEHEKELSFIILQLIHSLKSLQAQGIESIDSSLQNFILAKTKADKYNTLIFLSDSCYDENDYMSDSCRISLCQYALMLLLQLLGVQTPEDLIPLSENKFSSDAAKKTFEIAIALLSEEKAVSLSQTKTLFECFLWELTRVHEILDESDDVDSVLQRWMDVKRSNFIKNVIGDESLCDINVQSEYYSQFLIRTSIRNVKEILSYL